MRVFLFAFSFLFLQKVYCQVIDHTSTFKSSNSDKYIRIHYDNDYFTKTDYYYTQGIAVEVATPSLKRNPINHLLLRSASSEYKYGVVLNSFGYTPTSIASDSILVGDRPFAGNLAITSFLRSKDTDRRRLITSSLTLGLMGPGAGGKEIQQGIHRWIGYRQPLGWQYQVKNDLILTYLLKYEKNLAKLSNWFLINATGEAMLGTHTNRVRAGVNFMLGNFIDPYSRIDKQKKKVRYYLYAQAQPRYTFYDATLQGGIFSSKSPYTIPSSSIERLGFQGDYGIVLILKNVYLEYCQSVLSNEFKTGRTHRWGGVRVGVSF